MTSNSSVSGQQLGASEALKLTEAEASNIYLQFEQQQQQQQQLEVRVFHKFEKMFYFHLFGL